MIDRLTGTVLSQDSEGVVIAVAGVGFSVEVSAITLRDLPGVGEEDTLFTHLHVRDDAIQLFGFSTEEERELFRLLLGVSKIGPRLALAALSTRRAPDLKRALAAGDVALFASVPGIGKKTAERIILELREKMGEAALVATLSGAGVSQEADERLALARTALVELGYSVQEADQFLTGLDPEASVEELVRQALGGSP
jgi:Holliday junction DNA helicase RuvA